MGATRCMKIVYLGTCLGGYDRDGVVGNGIHQ
jgi:hypothetical protein